MLDQALAASAVVAAASACCVPEVSKDAITSTNILGWCFTIGSINFGVFGFIYGIYANAAMSDKEHLPIVSFLKIFCFFIAVTISIVFVLSVIVALPMQPPRSLWLIIFCLGVITVLSIVLVAKMRTPKTPQI